MLLAVGSTRSACSRRRGRRLPGARRSRPRRSAAPTRSTLDGPDRAQRRDRLPAVQALSDEFTKQFPNVTWNIRQDQFAVIMQNAPRLLAGDNPPDLIRLPTMVDLVKDGLLKNLDDYATAFGWDKWPASQLVQNRVAPTDTRGAGSLYAMGSTTA